MNDDFISEYEAPENYGKTAKRNKIINISVILLCLIITVWALVSALLYAGLNDKVRLAGSLRVPEYVDVRMIGIFCPSRSGKKLSDVKDIVIHYVGNPGTSAAANRNYFANGTTEVSSHFVVGLEGEVIQCLPLDEKSAASNHRNPDTISIEVCHPDAGGKFADKTYDALVKLTAWLCRELELTEDNIIRHYDVTGKMCPVYYVENEEAWETFKADVMSAALSDASNK